MGDIKPKKAAKWVGRIAATTVIAILSAMAVFALMARVRIPFITPSATDGPISVEE
ncbi:MAG: hypothetical protein IID31_11185 [Planctomycetes bacterium]|nr:hypothetical protein [Planctomycetota bacterium]